MFTFRPYQLKVFQDHSTGILILHWSRQIGKTTVLAAWAVERILRCRGHTVTVLSNSLKNGAEFIARASAFCEEKLSGEEEIKFRFSRHEIRLERGRDLSRIHALAANPRTARGFSGDLILDEIAFYEDPEGVWEAAEPILAARADFLCRIASTGNGKRNLFYRMTRDSRFVLSRVTRTDAWRMGVPIFDPLTRRPITPDEARAAALDKEAYDQNYECAFIGENRSLLNTTLIEAACSDTGYICCGEWSPEALKLFEEVSSGGKWLFAGVDVGRSRDRTVVTVITAENGIYRVLGFLRLEEMRLPEQQKRLNPLFRIPGMKGIAIDMTGLGLGLYEYILQIYGNRKVYGINFSSTMPAVSERGSLSRAASGGGALPHARVTEVLAVNLVRSYEESRLSHPLDEILREDLLLPRRTLNAAGRVSITADRDNSGQAGHADHFWSLALALEAARRQPGRMERRLVSGASRAGLMQSQSVRRTIHSERDLGGGIFF